MARVLVTGGAGFIGHCTVRLLAERKHRVSVVDNLSSGNHALPEARLHVMDIASPELRHVFKEEKPDYVIMLASQVGVASSIRDPLEDARVNVLGTTNLLWACVEFRVKKVVYASSAAVYGTSAGPVTTEDTDLRPTTFYGLSKLTAEKYVRMFGLHYGLPFTILRYSNVYGPGQERSKEPGVVSRFLQCALNGATPVVYGDGEQTRDFVYVEDVAQANLAALTLGENHAINISSGRAISVRRLLSTIARLTRTNLRPVFAPRTEGEIAHSTLDNSKAAMVLGWRPQTNLRSGLRKTLRHLLNTGDHASVVGLREALETPAAASLLPNRP